MYSILDQINKLTKTNKLILATFAFLAVLAFGGGRAHAATLNVSGGCTLPIAINSVNAGANQSGCTAVVSPNGYGTNDTITIPAGTITLAADLPDITESVTIGGAGMGSTIINGSSGQYQVFYTNSDVALTVKDLTITGFEQFAILADTAASLTVNGVEVDGTGALPSGGEVQGIRAIDLSSGGMTTSISNVYIHDLVADAGLVGGLVIAQYSGGTSAATLQNITVANLTNTKVSGGGGALGIIMAVGAFGDSFGSFGVLNTTASNITIDGIHNNNSVAAAFSSNAYSSGGDATVNTNINNVTIINTEGHPDSTLDVDSGAFYAVGIGIGAGTTATSNISVGNSLMASNTSDGISSNCITGDFSDLVSGAGSVVATVTSQGHNIFDDNSCASAFTNSTDQHNVSNIISTLGPLQNNGGAVPTRALLEGSPAISAGGSVLGVTTDARGITRPSTCPSVGAYQFEGAVCGVSTPSASGGNAGAPNTGADSVSITLSLLAGVIGLTTVSYALRKRQDI